MIPKSDYGAFFSARSKVMDPVNPTGNPTMQYSIVNKTILNFSSKVIGGLVLSIEISYID